MFERLLREKHKLMFFAWVGFVALAFIWLLTKAGDLSAWFMGWYYSGNIGEAESFFIALQDFLTLTLSLLIEATPFLLFGVTVATIIRFFVPAGLWTRLAAKNIVVRRLVLSFAGAFMPVCECGNVPVARSFLLKGLSPGDSITFLLAAPILNPIVLFITWQVFSFSPGIFWGRFIAAFIIANLVAVLISLLLKNRDIVRPSFSKQCKISHQKKEKRSFKNITLSMKDETLPLFRLLFFGAVIAGLVQVFGPREILLAIGSDPVLGILAMIVLGFVISICSSIDAFFALAFANIFTPGAIAAFLIAGPMVDIKMVMLLRSTFSVAAISLITALVALFSFIAGLIINWMVL